MEDAPENGKELSHSARANEMNEWLNKYTPSNLNFIGHTFSYSNGASI